MNFLAPLIFCGSLGGMALAGLFGGKSKTIPFYPLFIFSLALPAGFSIASLILFFSQLLAPSQGPGLSLVMATVLLAGLLLKWVARQNPAPSPALSYGTVFSQMPHFQKILFLTALVIAGITCLRFLNLFRGASLANIFGGWDALFFWNVKAKFFFRDPGAWLGMFSSELTWTHPDYPLLLPGAVAWGWNWNGYELQIWPPLVALGFVLSLACFIGWYLSAYVHPALGLIGAAYFLTLGAFAFWSASQYADVPLAFFMTAAGTALLLASRHQSFAFFVLTGWLAGCAAWTKNEGLFFVGWIFAAAFIFQRPWKISWDLIRNRFYPLILGLIIPLTAVVILKTSLAQKGDYLGSGRGFVDLLNALFGEPAKTKIILQSFPNYMADASNWNGLWYFFLSALAVGALFKTLRRTDTWLMAGLAGFILLGYFAVLHISPHHVVWQIQTALQRLILHAAGLALLFTFEIYGRLGSSDPSKNPAV